MSRSDHKTERDAVLADLVCKELSQGLFDGAIEHARRVSDDVTRCGLFTRIANAATAQGRFDIAADVSDLLSPDSDRRRPDAGHHAGLLGSSGNQWQRLRQRLTNGWRRLFIALGVGLLLATALTVVIVSTVRLDSAGLMTLIISAYVGFPTLTVGCLQCLK